MIEFIEVSEQTREYMYPNGNTVRVFGVVRFACPGTTHRLETSDGFKYIMAPGWLAIKIEAVKWTL